MANTIHKIMKVDPKFSGLIIGKGGTTIKSIATLGGNDCRIRHDNVNKGTFTISARNKTSIEICETKINELINSSKLTNNTKENKRLSNHRTHPTYPTYPVTTEKRQKRITKRPTSNEEPLSGDMNLAIERVTGYKWLPGKHWGDN